MFEAMTRDEALAMVAPYIKACGRMCIVLEVDALKLLGEERFQRLKHDPMRGRGPRRSGGFYFWNVADYLQFPDLRCDVPTPKESEAASE